MCVSVQLCTSKRAGRTADELPEVKVAPLGKDVLQLRDGHDAQDLEVQVVEVLAELAFDGVPISCRRRW